MSDQFPLITIAITCFNARDTIERAIASAVQQDWPNIEILIADDCSIDDSAEIIRKAITSLANARLIVNDRNLGTGGTRQRLLDEAEGEFIAFFDDDDESMKERLSTQYAAIIAQEQKLETQNIACYASGIRLYPNGYKKELPAIGSRNVIPHGDGMAESILYFGQREEWFYGSGTPTCCLMARTALLRQVGGFDAEFRRVEDLDLTIRLSLSNTYFVGCPENLFVQHATTGGDKTSTKNMDAELQLAQKYRDFLETRGMYYYAMNWPKLRHYHFSKQYMQFALTLFNLLLRYPVKTFSQLMENGPKRLRHERKMAS